MAGRPFGCVAPRSATVHEEPMHPTLPGAVDGSTDTPDAATGVFHDRHHRSTGRDAPPESGAPGRRAGKPPDRPRRTAQIGRLRHRPSVTAEPVTNTEDTPEPRHTLETPTSPAADAVQPGRTNTGRACEDTTNGDSTHRAHSCRPASPPRTTSNYLPATPGSSTRTPPKTPGTSNKANNSVTATDSTRPHPPTTTHGPDP